jgi:hypothetical protein
LYGSQSLCPFGASHGLFTSPLSPPLGKGLNSPTTLYDRGYPQTPSQGVALLSSINPNPFFIRRGFEPLSKPLANRWQGDVIDYGQKPPFVKDFLYGSQSLCPSGASHGLFTSLLSPPLEKGLKEREETKAAKIPCGKGLKEKVRSDKRRKSIKWKGAPFADYAKRWSMKGIDKAQRFS